MASGTAHPAAIQGVLDSALTGADAADYSLLKTGITSEAGDMINKYFWVHPMATSAKIITKLKNEIIKRN